MGKQIKKLIMLGVAGFAVYWLLTHHILLFGRDFEIAEKAEPTFTHTFYSIASQKELKYKGLDSVLENEDLYEVGIGQMLVDRGWTTREELQKVERELY